MIDRETEQEAPAPSKWRKLKASLFGHKPPPVEQVPEAKPTPPLLEPEQKAAPLPEPTEEKKGGRKEKGRSGSAKRQRVKSVRAVVTPAEYDAIQTRSRNAGLSTGAFLRACALGDKGPRAKRAPPIHGDLLGEAIAALNRVGSNVNQIAHQMNAGGHPDRAAIAEAKAELSQCFTALLKALGKTRE